MPWTGLLIALLSGTSIVEDTERVGAWFLLGSALVFGLPHGASDFWILKERASRTGSSTNRFPSLLIVYTLAAISIAALWFLLPDISILAFLILTAVHFGAGDQIWEDAGGRDFTSSFLRGLMVIASPLAFHAEESGAVLRALAPQTAALPLVDGALAWATWTLGASALALLGLDLLNIRRGIAFPSLKWLELGLLTLFFWLLTPLFAVAVYFVAVHSWRHVFRLGVYEEKTDAGEFSAPVLRVIAGFYMKALPITVLSLLGLVAVYLVFRADLSPLTAWTSAYLVLLSALTVPHAILISLTEKRLTAS